MAARASRTSPATCFGTGSSSPSPRSGRATCSGSTSRAPSATPPCGSTACSSPTTCVATRALHLPLSASLFSLCLQLPLSASLSASLPLSAPAAFAVPPTPRPSASPFRLPASTTAHRSPPQPTPAPPPILPTPPHPRPPQHTLCAAHHPPSRRLQALPTRLQARLTCPQALPPPPRQSHGDPPRRQHQRARRLRGPRQRRPWRARAWLGLVVRGRQALNPNPDPDPDPNPNPYCHPKQVRGRWAVSARASRARLSGARRAGRPLRRLTN
jgi:hypothetical protein